MFLYRYKKCFVPLFNWSHNCIYDNGTSHYFRVPEILPRLMLRARVETRLLKRCFYTLIRNVPFPSSTDVGSHNCIYDNGTSHYFRVLEILPRLMLRARVETRLVKRCFYTLIRNVPFPSSTNAGSHNCIYDNGTSHYFRVPEILPRRMLRARVGFLAPLIKEFEPNGLKEFELLYFKYLSKRERNPIHFCKGWHQLHHSL